MSGSDTENDSGTDEDVIDKEAEPKVCLRQENYFKRDSFFFGKLSRSIISVFIVWFTWGSCFRGSEILVETFPITVWSLKRYEGWFFVNHSELNF